MTDFKADDLKAPVADVKLDVVVDVKDEKAYNLLVIADSDLGGELRLAAFSKCCEWKPELFMNRKLSDIVQKTPFIWLNIKRTGCRQWIMKNLSGSPYNILLCHSGSSGGDLWVKQLSDANPEAVIVKKNKLASFDALSEEEILDQLLTKVIAITKPDSKLLKAAKFLFSCILKKL